MAKGGPEVGNTVPIKDANGNVTGWTDPATAESLGIISGAPERDGLVLGPGDSGGAYEYIPPTQTTQGGMAPEESMQGFEDGTWNILDPETGEYRQVAQTEDPFMYNPRGDLTNWAYDQHGNRVLLDTSADNWESFGAFNPELEGFQLGYQPDGRYGIPTVEQPTVERPTTQPPPPVVTQPPTNPMDPFDPDTGAGNPHNPTDDWFDDFDYVGYENAPKPEGDGSFQEGGPPVDTSWNWDFFREKAPGDRQWGGYDQDYQAFERYQPGMRSPWGMPNIQGGNRDFYQQQFVNQLRDEQGFQNRERAAQEARQAALADPFETISPQEMWKWAYGDKGLPEVGLGTGDKTPVSYDLNKAFNPGQTTNAEILRWAAGNEDFSDGAREFYNRHLNNPLAGGHQGTGWSSAGDPTRLLANIPTDPNVLTGRNQQHMMNLYNSIYNPTELGPYTPVGYASPIQWGSGYESYAAGEG